MKKTDHGFFQCQFCLKTDHLVQIADDVLLFREFSNLEADEFTISNYHMHDIA